MPVTTPVTWKGPPVIPDGVSAQQNLLKGLGFSGLTVDSVDGPYAVGDGQWEGRFYVLTQSTFGVDWQMKRRALTIVLYWDGDRVQTRQENGWVIAVYPEIRIEPPAV